MKGPGGRRGQFASTGVNSQSQLASVQLTFVMYQVIVLRGLNQPLVVAFPIVVGSDLEGLVSTVADDASKQLPGIIIAISSADSPKRN